MSFGSGDLFVVIHPGLTAMRNFSTRNVRGRRYYQLLRPCSIRDRTDLLSFKIILVQGAGHSFRSCLRVFRRRNLGWRRAGLSGVLVKSKDETSRPSEYAVPSWEELNSVAISPVSTAEAEGLVSIPASFPK
jgi:hypothetical protein